MINFNDINKEMSDDITAVTDWCTDIYDSNFSEYFKDSRKLFDRLKSKTTPITDEELSWILIDLPLRLFDVSAELNKFKVQQEVIKMRTKEKESTAAHDSTAKTVALRQEEASMAVIENKLLITAYSSVITRVESEISFCRELIMGAKKIWDSRRKSESVNPVSPTNESAANLPDYRSNQYIK